MKRRIDFRKATVLWATARLTLLFIAMVFTFVGSARVLRADRIAVTLVPRGYIPLVAGHEWGGAWQRVGNAVAEVQKFHSIARCDDGVGVQRTVYLLAGSDVGIYSLTDPGPGMQWTHEQIAADITNSATDVAFVPGECGQAYATILGHGVWRGDYDESEWTWIRVDKDDALTAARSVAIVPAVGSDELIIYVAGDFGIMRRTPLPTAAEVWQVTSRTTQTTSLTTDGLIVASVWNDGVYSRFDNALWSRLGGAGPSDKLVYEAVYGDGKGLAGTQTGAFRWTGTDWERIASIQETTFSVAMSNLGLFAGLRKTGIMASTDGGATWLPFNKGIATGTAEFQVRDLYVHADDEPASRCMYAATTTGIWEWGNCH